ncbi:MAG: CocE/NonD family hydrolase [Ardenticatenaceae bacterium]|nr:CocE/NonD family hydrolase [Ardenticatenaceae bacterium]MCB9445363.1 CocE/NonD family hydrolase [Ardenticatenaceae bacterium]
MQIKTDFPYRIREIENTWIPLADGTRLAARIWLPENAEQNPVPALLEYLPYRKSDGTAVRDALRHPYFAGHGYASIRVDMRGSGDSDGILYDEYLKQEQDDALEVLAWIAEQPWCTGSVGIFGKSWGGFNALQIAARRPPPLKAVIAMHFTDDRYNDDVHYMGGCLLTSQMLAWAAIMFAANAAPPDPRFVGERWREMWLERMEKTPPYIQTWLSHQRKDAYWKHGSVSEDYRAIEIPVYAVGGWADAYNNSIPRLLAGLSGPRKGIIGPWSHNFPETGVPGPAIGFLQESLRWWDHWLKGVDTGIMAEPMLRCWMLEAVRPSPFYAERPGRWIAELAWPSPNIHEQTYFFNSDGTLGFDKLSQRTTTLSILGQQNHGLEGGEWGGLGYPGEPAGDQRAADGQSLSFTSAPLAEPIEILGYPEVDLALASDQPLALVSVRLSDVAPDGASTLVSWGLLNLTHRDNHETPMPLEPDRRYDVTVRLNVKAYQLPAGHRWRVSVSPTNFRHAWPSPQPVTLQLFTGKGCRLRLPVRQPQEADAALRSFLPPEVSPPLPIETLRTELRKQFVQRDIVNGMTEMVLDGDNGRIRFTDTGMITEDTGHETLTIHDGDPLSIVNQVQRTLRYEREDWRIRIDTDSKLTADADNFHVTCLLEGYENETRVFAKTWDFTIPRDLI